MDWAVAKKYVIPVGIVVGGFVLGWIFQKVVSKILSRAAGRTRNKWDDVVIRSLRGMVLVWVFLAGVAIALKTVSLPKPAARPLDQAVSVLAVLSVVVFLVRLAKGLVSNYFDAQAAVPASIIRTISSAGIYVIGFLVILQLLGLSITPMLTALGVGGLAVALGLQNTLATLFAGIQILMTKQVRRGDFIRLENGEEGVIVDITWRNATIRTLTNSLVIVPNDKLASSIVKNFHLPDAETAVLVEARVGYDSDLKRVEKIIEEVAAAVMQDVAGGIPGFQPFVRYHTLGESGINFTVILRGREYVDNFLIKHEFLKRLHERFRAEGIEFPLPGRRVYLEEEKGGAPSSSPTEPER